MQRSQWEASDWFKANKLNLNELKTQTMIFSTRRLENFENPENIKFLGVIVDTKLCWDQHVDYQASKLFKVI